VICEDTAYNILEHLKRTPGISSCVRTADRAYRIGQKNDVQVVRLVSQGTVDELKYLRQLYKVQLKQDTLQGDSSAPRAARMFRGVQGDKYRKGVSAFLLRGRYRVLNECTGVANSWYPSQELFGTENLLKFKDGCFLDEIWKKVRPGKSRKRTQGLNIHETSALAQELSKLGEDRCEELLDDDIGELDAVMKKEDSTTHNESLHASGGIEDKSSKGIAPTADVGGLERGGKMPEIGAHALNHEDLFREDRGGAAIEMGDEGFDDEMGGATQNAVAVYEERGEDFAEDSSDNDEDKVESTCVEISSKGDQNENFLSKIKKEDSSCLDTEEGAIHAYPENDRCNTKESASKIVCEHRPPAVRRNDEGEKKCQKSAPQSLKINLVGQPATNGIETTFSVADIPIPTYQSTKSKGKKKKRKRKASL
jgi:hypothetical protein